MKTRLKVIFISLFILLSSFVLSCCKSNSIPIPGNRTILLKNIYIEYSKLADAYFNIEKYSDAISYYKKAMEDKDLYWPCFYKMAKCYVYSADWNNALEMYKVLLDKDPDNSSLKASIAYIYAMSGDVENAISSYTELLNIQPNNEKYIENYLAIVLGKKDIFEKYKEDFDYYFDFFKDNYSKNENIKTFQSKYDEYVTPKEEESDKSESALDSVEE